MNLSMHFSHEQVGPCDEVQVSSLGDVYAYVVCTETSLCKQDYVFVAKWISIGHYTFQQHAVVVHDVKKGIPLFGRIEKMTAVNSGVYLICEMLHTVYFDDHFHFYEVERTYPSKLACISLNNLQDPIPLQQHHVDYEDHSHLFVMP